MNALRRIVASLFIIAVPCVLFAVPMPWTASNLDPAGGTTFVRNASGAVVDGDFIVQLLCDRAGDGPDSVRYDRRHPGQPSGDDSLLVQARVTAPLAGVIPAGAFSFFYTLDSDSAFGPPGSRLFFRVFDGTHLNHGTYFADSDPFDTPDVTRTQTVLHFPPRMRAYIGNRPPQLLVRHSALSVHAGDRMTFEIAARDQGQVDFSAVTTLPGSAVHVNPLDELNAEVELEAPPDSVGDYTLTLIAYDGQFRDSLTVDVQVLPPLPLPSVFHLAAPGDGDTAWDGDPLVWTRSQRSGADSVYYTLFWSLDPTMSEVDSVTGLTDTSLVMNLAMVAGQAFGSDNGDGALGRGRKVDRLGGTHNSPDGTALPRERALSEAVSSTGSKKIGSGSSMLSRFASPYLENRGDISTVAENLLHESGRARSGHLMPAGELDETEVTLPLEEGQTFYWRVRACTDSGGVRESVETWSAVAERPDPPAPFALIAPADSASPATLAPLFRWRRALDPDTGDTVVYDLIWTVEGSGVFDTVRAIPDTLLDLASVDNAPAGAANLRTALGRTTVSDLGGDVNKTHESDFISVREEKGKTLLPITVKSSSKQASFVGDVATKGRASKLGAHPRQAVPGDARVVNDLPDEARVVWWVEAVDLTGLHTASTSERVLFSSVAQPPSPFALLAPADSTRIATTHQVTLAWSTSVDNDSGAVVRYDLLATRDSTLAEPADFPVVAADLDTTIAVLDLGGVDECTWRWAVRAVSGTDTTWSEAAGGGVFHFEVSHPDPPSDFTLLTPENEGVWGGVSPTLIWEEATDSDLGDSVRYVLVWSTDNWETADSVTGLVEPEYTFDVAALEQEGRLSNQPNASHASPRATKQVDGKRPVAVAAFTNAGGRELDEFSDGAVVRWKVRAQDGNTFGRWSDPPGGWSFTVYANLPPEPFSLVAPPDSSVLNRETATFTWRRSHDPERAAPLIYAVQTAGDSTFDECETMDAGVDSSLELPVARWAPGVHWWRVATVDADQRTTLSREAWRFVVPASGVAEKAVLPQDYAIAGIYPNPFNPSTVVRVALPETSDLRVAVFNLLGARVARLAEGRFSAGYHEFTFRAEDLASGVYFVRVAVPGRFERLEKVVLVR